MLLYLYWFVGPGPGFDDIEEVACMDEDVGFLADDLIYRFLENCQDLQDTRRICKACYKEAVRAEQMASVPLPGTFGISWCSRITADIGKCSVCGIAIAVWLDREVGVKLCEHCYGRGVREEAQEVGVV